jgi:hypothetical protein
MHDLPQLEQEQLKEWKEKILGDRSNRFPDSFLFEQLFSERSPLSHGKLFSDRLRLLVRKFREANIYEALQAMFGDILKHLRDNGYLTEQAYEEEYEKCIKLTLDKK